MSRLMPRAFGLFLFLFPAMVLFGQPGAKDGPWKATLPYFAPDLTHDPAYAGANLEKLRQTLRERFHLTGDCDCRIVIATVPDPVNSRLGLFFDRSMESIQRAAEDSGWEFDRQWMPWSDRVTVDTAGPDRYYAQTALLEARQQQPGVLVFRRQSGSLAPHLLLILLVAETPVGVNVAQMQNALDDNAALSSTPRIDILGPTFSGSFPSLTRVLKQHWSLPSKFVRVQSGTATSSPYAKTLRETLGKDKAEFHSAVEDSGSMIDILDGRLGELNTDRAHTAILVEDESGFGHTVVSKLREKEMPKGDATRLSEAVLTIRFPREISAVRNAYQEAVQTTPNAKVDNKQAPLSFSLKDPQSGEDTLPIFAKAHMPLAQNAVLTEIATTLKRDHINMAEIVATNVLDTLFLIRVLHAACPDVRLLVPSADLLFVQAEIDEPMTGTLILSNYPLFWPNQKWTTGQGQQTDRVVFSDSNSQGVYNAGRILLYDPAEKDGHAMAEYISPFPHHGSDTHPPVWLLEVTRSGLWPIRVFDRDGESSKWFKDVKQPGALPGLRAEPPSQVWRTLALCVGLLSLAFAIALRAAQRFSWRSLYVLALPPGDTSVPIRAVYMLTLAACLLLLHAIFLVPFVRFNSPKEMLSTFDPLLLLLACSLVALVAVLVYLLRRLAGFEARAITAVAFLVSAAACTLFILACLDPVDGIGSLFVFRSLHPSAGVSPVLPIGLLIIGCGLFVWAHLKRTVFAEERKPTLPAKYFDGFAATRLGAAETSLNNCLESFFPAHLPVLVGTLAITVILFLLNPRNFLFTIEPQPYRVLLLTMFVILILFVTGTALRFGIGWSRLKILLTRVDRLRLGGAFRRLPREFSGEAIWQQKIRARSYSTMTRGMECLDVMAGLPETDLRAQGIDPAVLQVHRCSLRAALDDIFRAEFEGRSETSHESLCARAVADKCAGYLVEVLLVPAWKSGLVDLDSETEGEGADSAVVSKRAEEPVYRLAAEFVSLRFASFIRYVLLQLRNLLGFVSVGFAFLAATLLTYPFQAPQTIRWFLTIIFLIISVPALTALTQMSKNPVLRRLASAKSGGVDAGLIRKLAYFGSLPLLGVLSAQFPALSKWLGSWLQPTLEALR